MVILFGKRYLKAVQQSCVQKEGANKYYRMVAGEHLQKLLPQLWATCSVLLPKNPGCMWGSSSLWIICLARMKSGFEWNLSPSTRVLLTTLLAPQQGGPSAVHVAMEAAHSKYVKGTRKMFFWSKLREWVMEEIPPSQGLVVVRNGSILTAKVV